MKLKVLENFQEGGAGFFPTLFKTTMRNEKKFQLKFRSNIKT